MKRIIEDAIVEIELYTLSNNYDYDYMMNEIIYISQFADVEIRNLRDARDFIRTRNIKLTKENNMLAIMGLILASTTTVLGVLLCL